MSQTEQPTKRIFICGSALQGQPDHANLQFINFRGAAKTRPTYRLHAAGDGWHPAIYEIGDGGISIPGEIYEQTQEQFETLCANEPPHMYPADIVLDNGDVLTAFLYPKAMVEQNNLPDISHYGGWAAYKTAPQG
jgi:gamma-glutamylaminecyclotransferase